MRLILYLAVASMVLVTLSTLAARHVWLFDLLSHFLLIKGPLLAIRFARGPAIGSDHFPVLAELRLIAGDP